VGHAGIVRKKQADKACVTDVLGRDITCYGRSKRRRKCGGCRKKTVLIAVGTGGKRSWETEQRGT